MQSFNFPSNFCLLRSDANVFENMLKRPQFISANCFVSLEYYIIFLNFLSYSVILASMSKQGWDAIFCKMARYYLKTNSLFIFKPFQRTSHIDVFCFARIWQKCLFLRVRQCSLKCGLRIHHAMCLCSLSAVFFALLTNLWVLKHTHENGEKWGRG